jgi:hypothetical protein
MCEKTATERLLDDSMFEGNDEGEEESTNRPQARSARAYLESLQEE